MSELKKESEMDKGWRDRTLYELCPQCEKADLERRGHKDVCPNCNYVQP